MRVMNQHLQRKPTRWCRNIPKDSVEVKSFFGSLNFDLARPEELRSMAGVAAVFAYGAPYFERAQDSKHGPVDWAQIGRRGCNRGTNDEVGFPQWDRLAGVPGKAPRSSPRGFQ